jgi:hypothetical protein
MKAVVIDEWGSAPAIRDIPVPELRPRSPDQDPGGWRQPVRREVRTGEVAQMPHQLPYTLACLPLEEAPQALEQYRSGHVRGKIALLPN